MGLVYHFLSGPGTLGEHLQMLLGESRAEATLAERWSDGGWDLSLERNWRRLVAPELDWPGVIPSILRPDARRHAHLG